MLGGFTKDINRYRDYASIFSRSEVISLITGDYESINLKISRHYDSIPKGALTSYLNFIKHAYSVLDRNYQNEYLVKNSFLTNWLIDELGREESIIFNEFRAGDSVVDLAMFNGVSKAFEIKTEFDSDKRLKSQISDYRQCFNEVYLIVPSNKVQSYKKYEEEIGIISYDQNNPNSFNLECTSKRSYDLNPQYLMRSLRTEEYKSIVESYFGELSGINSFNQYEICYNLICQIPIRDFNKLYIDQFKKSRFVGHLSKRYYKELNQISLSLKLNKADKLGLINNLDQPIRV